MDPARKAMIEGYKSPPPKPKDVMGPKFDAKNRVSKSSRPSRHRAGGRGAAASGAKAGGAASKYITLDQQSEQFLAQEDKFVLKQAKKKADIRVREQRARPIDYLAFSLRFIDDEIDVFDADEEDMEISIPAPQTVLDSLKDEAQFGELIENIKSYSTLEESPRNKEYWACLLALCADRRQRLRPQGPEGRAVSSVASEIDSILSPKTHEQLEALEVQIKAKLQSEEPVDTDYWEQLLKSLRVCKAKATLSRICQAIKQARVDMLRTRDPELAKALDESDGFTLGPAMTPTAVKQTSSRAAGKPATRPPATSAPPLAEGPLAAPQSGGVAITETTAAPPPGTARFAATTNEDFSQATRALYEREVARGIGEDEEIFAAEEAVLGNEVRPLWADKYRPRKPRYFNRVQMGYEWNKYNQTHYSHANPPPRTVKGYKFNLFYPELIDKTKAPTYKITREDGRRRGESFAPAGQEDTCLIRFIAGPPYQDVAFRIVDREWDYSAKKERGFRSSFDKGILQLHFQFKKIYYRK